MNNFFKTLIAGYGAKKLGGGCLITILILFVIYYVMGTCNGNRTQPQQPVPYQQGQHALLQNNRRPINELLGIDYYVEKSKPASESYFSQQNFQGI